ncbi:hypothetical protein BDM02DRAFT_3110856 [Thelephora ganbajun]|uniref:Uncharacterized protein n=1 Tax=Thelephora ganbajun TaxID=370292 RepID=A0ACB6ZPR6_THEGA|nr:hypothetical protein BDM02DRAFT_3110856 [Thelephora ganbajun]
MNTISDSIPLTEAQKTVLDQLHNALNDAAGNVIAHFPASHPLSPLSSRSLEDRQLVNPLATLNGFPPLANSLDRASDLLSAFGIGANPAVPLTDFQKQVVAKLTAAFNNAVGDVTADFPKSGVLPLNHARSVERRSLEDIISLINHVAPLSSALSPVISLLSSLGVTNGTPLDNVQKQALSRLEAVIAEVVQNLEAHGPTVHIEHTREEHEHWGHHELHRDGHHSHDEHKHKDDHKPHDAHKDKDNNESRDAHQDGHRPQDAHKDDYKSPHVHEDHYVQGGDRESHHREGPRDECRHHKDGKDRNEDPSLLKISLGHSHHP